MKKRNLKSTGLSVLTILMLSACGGGDDASTVTPPADDSAVTTLSDSYVVINTSTDNTVPFMIGDTAGKVMLAPVISPDINENDQLIGFFGLASQPDGSKLSYSVVLDQDADYVRPKEFYLNDGTRVIFNYVNGALTNGETYNASINIKSPDGQVIELYLNLSFSDSATATQLAKTSSGVSKVLNLLWPKKVSRALKSAPDIMPMVRSATQMVIKTVKDVVNVKDLLSDLMLSNAADLALQKAVDSDNILEQTGYYGLFATRDFISRMAGFSECALTKTMTGCLGAIETIKGDIDNLYELGKLGIEEIKNRQHKADIEEWAVLQDQTIKNRVRRLPKSTSRPASTYEQCKISYSEATCAKVFDVDLSVKPKPTGFTKLDITGKVLSDNASDWTCARDNKTGMVWEVIDEGTVLYGNIAGYLSSYRAKSLCGYSDWRILSTSEYGRLSVDPENVPGLRAGAYYVDNGIGSSYMTVEVHEYNIDWGHDQRYCEKNLVPPNYPLDPYSDPRPYCPGRGTAYFSLIRG